MAQQYYTPFTVQGAQVPSTQTDFPVLINYTDARFKSVGNGGHVANSGGFDIRPYSDTGLTSPLVYELERYNAATGEVIMWVKIPSLTGGSNSLLYLGYGDAGLGSDMSSTATWSNGFQGVYHMKPGTPPIDQSSATGIYHGVNIAGAPTAAAGQIDGCGNFSAAGQSSFVSNANMGSFAALTYSAWIKATSFPGSFNRIICIDDAGGHFFTLSVTSAGKMSAGMGNGAATSNYSGTGTNTLVTGTWYYVACAYDSTVGCNGYVNGALDKNVAANGPCSTTISYPAAVGVDANAGGYWNGLIDEARISSVARSANWITTEYNNQLNPTSFMAIGTEVAFSGGGGGGGGNTPPCFSMRRDGDLNLFGGDRNTYDRAYGCNRRGDRGLR